MTTLYNFDKLKIYTNKRSEPDEFHMNHVCHFCTAFVGKVIQIPSTELFICKGCLNKMINAIDKDFKRDFKHGRISE